MRRVIDREKPFEMDEVLYMNTEEVARWVQPYASKGNIKKFIDLIQKNHFTDMYKIFGADGPAMHQKDTGQPPFFKLRSGKLVSCSRGWNPLVYAFVFDHIEICNFVSENPNMFDLRQCFMVLDYFSLDHGHDHQGHVEQDMMFEQQRRSSNLYHPDDYEKYYRRNFLSLLINNKSGTLALLLNEFYFLWDLDDVIFMIGEVVGIAGDTATLAEHRVLVIEDIINSQCFKSLYCQHVHSTGHESYKNSFWEFFERVLAPLFRGVSKADEALAQAVEALLKKAPFNAGFGMFLYITQDEYVSLFPRRE